MNLFLVLTLIALVPFSGTFSGGRLTSFAMKRGLIPSTQWLYVPGMPVLSTTGNFTEITYQGGYERSFRVLSSGETAGIHPLISSRVNEEGYAAQMLIGNFLFYCVKNQETGSYASSYKNLTLDIRGSSSESLRSSIEYSDNYILLAATDKTSAIGISIPLTETFAIGPAYCKDQFAGHWWLMSELEMGPLTIVSSPAIDDHNVYRRLYGIAEYSGSELLYGWDGTECFSLLSFQKDDLSAVVSLILPGIMIRYKPCENIGFLASHREEGWFQGELQGNYRGITGGIEIRRDPERTYQFGFSAGIAMGNNNIPHAFSFKSPWFSQLAIASSLY